MLVNFVEMLNKAKKEHYAVPQFNINNLEWTKYILEECKELNIPVILGVSEGAAKYMGGFNVVAAMVKELVKSLNVETPVCIHLDHGTSKESCIKAIDAGFTSVMIDASRHELPENIRITKEVVEYAHERNVSVEAEVGHIGGTEDNITATSSNATLEDCQVLYENTKIDSLAPALGSVHGFYKGEPNLDFETMEIINNNLPIPLVLHGGTGIPADKIAKAISCGISKININTDLQAVWSNAVREKLENDKEVYDPRKVIGSGENAMKTRIKELVTLFGTRL
ncbi:MAG: class II fructose-1,6-bisphosphate aldolase [Bacilli bacterium]|nr:class II fructose-1,6-bisphosphate aldolase [Bacilli bacterium]